MTYRSYFDRFDPKATRQDHPIVPELLEIFGSMSLDARHAHQDALFCRALAFAWKLSCYGRLWRGQGIEPGDVDKLLVFSKDDLITPPLLSPSCPTRYRAGADH